MDSLEPHHLLILVFGLLIAVSVIQAVLNPPRDIQWSDLPVAIREAAESALPGFTEESTRHKPNVRKYVMLGSYQGQPGKLEIECDRNGGISEIEFEAVDRASATVSKRSCEFSEIPPVVSDHMNRILGADSVRFQPHRVMRGKSNDREIFEVDGRTPTWNWEFEMTAEGRLIELEKEKPR